MGLLLEQTIRSAADGLASKAFSSMELTKAYLGQIRGLDLGVHAYLDVFEGTAMDQAHASDERRAAGKSAGVLDGIPLAIKDNILIQDQRATAGSQILANYRAAYDATVITRLREAGSVFFG